MEKVNGLMETQMYNFSSQLLGAIVLLISMVPSLSFANLSMFGKRLGDEVKDDELVIEQNNNKEVYATFMPDGNDAEFNKIFSTYRLFLTPKSRRIHTIRGAYVGEYNDLLSRARLLRKGLQSAMGDPLPHSTDEDVTYMTSNGDGGFVCFHVVIIKGKVLILDVVDGALERASKNEFLQLEGKPYEGQMTTADGVKWSYIVSNGSVQINSVYLPKHNAQNAKPLTEVAVPSVIEGMPVREVGDSGISCFGSDIEGVKIPSGVRVINGVAFRGCSKLKAIALPDTLEIIGYQAFENCVSLEALAIPKGVTNIEGSAFANCTSLKVLHIPGNVITVGAEGFAQCRSVVKLQIDKGVQEILGGAFRSCDMLTEVVIPDGMLRLGGEFSFSGVFEDCKSLERISLPKSLLSFSSCLLKGCSSLKEVCVPQEFDVERINQLSLPKNVQVKRSSFNGGVSSVAVCVGAVLIGGVLLIIFRRRKEKKLVAILLMFLCGNYCGASDSNPLAKISHRTITAVNACQQLQKEGKDYEAIKTLDDCLNENDKALQELIQQGEELKLLTCNVDTNEYRSLRASVAKLRVLVAKETLAKRFKEFTALRESGKNVESDEVCNDVLKRGTTEFWIKETDTDDMVAINTLIDGFKYFQDNAVIKQEIEDQDKMSLGSQVERDAALMIEKWNYDDRAIKFLLCEITAYDSSSRIYRKSVNCPSAYAVSYQALEQITNRVLREQLAMQLMEKHIQLNGGSVSIRVGQYKASDAPKMYVNHDLKEENITRYIRLLNPVYVRKLYDNFNVIIEARKETFIRSQWDADYVEDPVRAYDAYFVYVEALLKYMPKKDVEAIAGDIKKRAAEQCKPRLGDYYIGMPPRDFFTVSVLSGQKIKAATGKAIDWIASFNAENFRAKWVFSSKDKVRMIELTRRQRYAVFEKEDDEFWEAFMRECVSGGQKNVARYEEDYDESWDERCYMYKSIKYHTSVKYGINSGKLLMSSFEE